MAGKRDKPEEIVSKLREIGVRVRQQELARLDEEVRNLNEIDQTARAREQYEALNEQWSAARNAILRELQKAGEIPSRSKKPLTILSVAPLCRR